jgi:eukaryotic-like serine/threonine-protein kinase
VTLVAGTKLGPYEILAPIGAGGMGEVYRARDERLKRDVAIKVLPATFSADADRLRRFEQEAQTAGGLNHPNITAVYDLGSHDGAPYIVTELLEGETLRSRLGPGAIPQRKAMDYAIQLAKGLAAAHEKGIVHRDLKPENVFLTNDGRVKILDFGLAKLKPETVEKGQTDLQTVSGGTQPGVVLGTMGYMAPEQVRGKPADKRSDLFAFGTILYEMLAGQRAFRGDTAADTITAILTKEPPDLSSTNRDVHPGLDRILRHCLEKNPEERFESARDVAFDLEALSGLSTPTAATLAAAAPSPRRRSLAIPFAIAGLLVGILVGVFAGRRTAVVAQPNFQRLTFQRGMIYSGRFGPDGQTAYYSASWDGGPPKIYSLRPGVPESSPLPVPPARMLGISRAGELAILVDPRSSRFTQNIGTLARVPISGGVPKEVLQDATSADWLPGGSELAAVHNVTGKDRLEYPIGKVLYETAGWIQDPRFSPDGKRIAFIDHAGNSDGGAVALVDLAGKKTELAAGFATVQGLAWSTDGGEIWFTAARTGIQRGLFAVTPSGRLRLVRTMQGTPALLDMIGSNALITEDDYRSGTFAFLPGQAEPKDLGWFDWTSDRGLSADGKSLLFDESGEGGGDKGSVYLRPTDGSAAVRLSEGTGVALSPDGAYALTRTGDEPQRFVIIPVKAGQSRQFPNDPFGVVIYGGFFPDGQRFVFEANEKGKGARLYVQSVAGGAATPISAEGISYSRLFVSPDAKWIAALGPDRRIALYPSAGGSPTVLTATNSSDLPAGWTADGRSLYISNGYPCRIDVVDVSSGVRTHVRDLVASDAAGMNSRGAARVTTDAKTATLGFSRILSTLYWVRDLR